jgi:hypothetical protein
VAGHRRPCSDGVNLSAIPPPLTFRIDSLGIAALGPHLDKILSMQ